MRKFSCAKDPHDRSQRMIKNELKELIADRRALIGVIGLGYVGLPLIVEFGLKGFKGIGFEVDKAKTEAINEGRSYIVDVPDANLKKCVDGGFISATTDFSRLAEDEVQKFGWEWIFLPAKG